ncbi:iron complex outermembrane receptor protein [Winogradskyella epiphytica]|uniref:Iron complex outermembrane receptor protein n=1 Tax=Winogradskyella epiphytica TaxID=262005 RepID=A0A2V4XED4_9FLAO|nr:TonB-dependent receptor [Winogradskyella epiphytica]PYE81115.1 iron complex outermembrane receptor protein [Winogradskyella epiphytica]GGW66965.1 TonB-dependent receptor [Winogradskyella epiphytica]
MKDVILLLLLFFYSVAEAQIATDSIQRLDEVVLSDVKLKRHSKGYKVSVLNDSVLQRNGGSFTDLLRFNSIIYFKENGYGMVSSPSFRGTNASQTAVIWNGISINSQLTGQTDFNTVNVTNFSSVVIRSGGGSVQYGSGAIGGSIHLNNSLKFNAHFENTATLSYGSYDSKKASYLSSYANGKFSINLGLQYIDSENDYKYLNSAKRNTNGAYNNASVNVTLGYVLSDTDVLKLYHQSFIGDREFSGTINSPSLAKYKDQNFRTMIEWERHGEKVDSKFKVAHLQEHFKYFGNKNTKNFTFGKVNTYLINYTSDIDLNPFLKLKPIIAYNYYEGSGSSFANPNRTELSTTALLQYKPNNSWQYGLNLRQDITSSFKSPMLMAFDMVFEVSPHYTLKLNGSKNHRVPTFNDLYWQPGGNLNLSPETSYQVDFGQELRLNKSSLKLNTYYIKTNDLIQWVPGNSGFWSPENVAKTQNYGAEVGLDITKTTKDHNFSLQLNYAYTVSEDLETKKQLIYVPYHKANANLAYNYKRLSVFFQHLFNGEVYTTKENLSGRFYSVEAYHVNNFGINYQLFKTHSQHIDMSLKVFNLFNTAYENVAFRPMPDRNFNFQIQYNF